MLRLLPLLLGLVFLTGCGRAPLAASPVPAGAPRAAAVALTTLPTLAAHATDASWEGRRVAVTAGFERATFTIENDRTCRGYRLVADGAGLLVANVYTAAGDYPGAPADARRELAAGPAAQLLTRGATADVVGRFHVARRYASHSGVGEVPAALEIVTIDGRPLAELQRGG